MSQLTQKYITVQVPPPTPVAQTVPFVKPLSYEFRVAEHLDDAGKITRVALQVQVWEHDEYGAGIVKQYWQDVPRCKFNKDGAILTV
jgi:hypothetical protein